MNISNGPNDLKGVTNALVVCQTNVENGAVTGTATRASYVFVAGKNTSQMVEEFSVGIATGEQDDEPAVYTQSGKKYVKIGTTRYELDANADINSGNVVIWIPKGDKISVKYVLPFTDINDDEVVSKVDGELVYLSNNDVIDTEVDEEDYEETTFILVNASLSSTSNGNRVKFSSVKNLGLGINKASFAKKDRLIRTTINSQDVIMIIRIGGLKDDSVISNGYLEGSQSGNDAPDPADDDTPIPTLTPKPTATPTPTPTTGSNIDWFVRTGNTWATKSKQGKVTHATLSDMNG